MTPQRPPHEPADGLRPESHRILQEILRLTEDIRRTVNRHRKDLLTVDEVAAMVGRTPLTVCRWVREGRLRATRVEGTGPRGRLLIPSEQLSRLVHQGLGAELPPLAGPNPPGDG